MRLLVFAAAAMVMCGTASAQGLGAPLQTIGGWTVHRSTDPMTDEPSCVATFGERGRVQLTHDSFAVSYRGRGGLSSYRIRLDDDPPWDLRLATRIDRDISAFVLEGRDFERIISARRIRIQTLTILNSVVDDDVDLSAVQEVLAVLRSAQCLPATGEADTKSLP
jgi:hypothetical protein